MKTSLMLKVLVVFVFIFSGNYYASAQNARMLSDFENNEGIFSSDFDPSSILNAGSNGSFTLSSSDDDKWIQDESIFPGTNGTIFTMLEHNGYVYVGGSFTYAGGIYSPGIARFSVSTGLWEAMTTSFSSSGARVEALAVRENTLFVGGLFSQINGQSYSNIAQYNLTNKQWSGLGDGTDGTVKDMVVSNSELFVGGEFDTAGGNVAKGVASYNIVSNQGNSSWFPLSGIQVNGYVYALMVDGSDLYVGGEFNTVSVISDFSQFDETVNNVFKYFISNGEYSGKLGDGTNGRITALASTINYLYIGGNFSTGNGPGNSKGIARYDKNIIDSNTGWSGFGDGLTGDVNDILIDGTTMYVVGDFQQQSTPGDIVRAATYDLTVDNNNSGWSVLGDSQDDGEPMDAAVYEIIKIGSTIYAAGEFTEADGKTVSRMAKLSNDASTWNPISMAVNGRTYSFAVYQDNIIMAGDIINAGGVNTNRLVRYNLTNKTWHNLGDGANTTIRAAAVMGDYLYVGGEFTTIGGKSIGYFARYNLAEDNGNDSWESVGVVDGPVYVIKPYSIDDRSYVFFGGDFDNFGGVASTNFALYQSDGTLHRLDYKFNGSVRDLHFDGTYIYFAGEFTSVLENITANRIARVPGESDQFQTFGDGLSGTATGIEVADGKLYVSGFFTTAGGTTVNGIGQYDLNTNAGNESWSSLGTGVDLSGYPFDYVWGLELVGNKLYAGGYFQEISGINANSIARYDIVGETWQPLGSGITGGSAFVYGMLNHDNKLFVGGNFTTAGGKPANDFATWNSLDQVPAKITLVAPADLATDVGKRPTFSWNADDLAATYQIQVATTLGFVDPVLVDVSGITASEYTLDTDLDYAPGIFWRVRGFNASGNPGEWSDRRTFERVPDQVSLYSPSDGTTGLSPRPELTWEQTAGGRSSYQIQISKDNSFSSIDVSGTYEIVDSKSVSEVEDITTFSFTPSTDLDYFTTYYWRVRALNDGESPGEWSEIWDFETQLGPVTKTAPVDGANSQDIRPLFTWDHITGANKYQVVVSTSSDLSNPTLNAEVFVDPDKSVGDLNSTHDRYTPTSDLNYNTRYYWNVRGIKGFDPSYNGVYGDTTSFLTKLPQVTTSIPGNDQSNQLIRPTFQWNSVAGADQYRIQISTSSEFTEGNTTEIVYENIPQKSAELNNGFFEYTLEEEYELDYNTLYYWRVRGEDSGIDFKSATISVPGLGNTGDYSESKNFTTQLPPPAQITLTSPANEATGQPIRPTFDWEPVDFANWYYLEIYTNAELSGDPVYFKDEIFDPNRDIGKSTGDTDINVEVAEFPFTIDQDLEYNRTYYWQVRGTNNTGNGEFSDPRSFRTTWDTPGTVTLVSPTDGSANISLTPTLSWQPATNAQKYTLEVSTSSDFNNRDAIVYEQTDLGALKSVGTSTVENYEHAIPSDVLDNDTEYYWRVRGTNPDLDGEWSTTWNFRTLWPLPPKVTLISPADGATKQQVRTTFTWDSMNYSSRYLLEIYTTSDLSGDPVYSNDQIWDPNSDAKTVGDAEVSNGISTVEFTLPEGSELDHATTYYWHVRGINSQGNGEFSTSRNFFTYWEVPSLVTLVSPSNGENGLSLTPTLTWQEAINATWYDLEISTSSDFTNRDAIVYEATNLESERKGVGIEEVAEFTHDIPANTLEYNTTYYWRVRAQNPDFDAPWSTPWSFTTIVAAPGVVTELLTPEDGATGVAIRPEFSWTNIDFADEYDLRVWDNEAMSGDPVYTASGIAVPEKSAGDEISNGVTINHTATQDLENNTEYHWQVLARNSTGDGPWSALSDFTTIVPLPARVTLASPEDGATEVTRNPVLTWSVAQNAVSYEFMMDTSEAFDEDSPQYVRVPEATGTQVNFGGTPLLANTTYYWRVRASNAAGNSPWTDTWSFTTLQDLPAQVSLLYPNNTEEGVALRPEFKWEASERSVSYELEVSRNQDYSNPVLSRNTGLNLTFTPAEDLDGLTTYWFRVRGVSEDDVKGPWSTPRSFTTQTDLPGAVALTSPADATTGVALMPQLSWQAATRAATYRIQVSTDMNFGGDATTMVEGLETTTLNWATKLFGSTTYYWRVQGVNPKGLGPWSTARSFTTDLDVPGKVFLRSPNNNESNVSLTPEFTWSRLDGADTYQLQVSRNQNFGSTDLNDEEIAQPQSGTIVKVDFVEGFNLRATTTYYYRVRAKNSKGYGEWSDVRTFTTEAAQLAGKVRNIQVRQITTKQVVSKTHSVQSTAAFEISWTPPAFDGGTEIVDYRIVYRTADETAWTTYEREASTDTVAIVTGFESGVAYAFDVLAVNAVGAPEPTDDPPVVVSIETEEIPDQVTLMQNYPNPFNPATTIRFSLPTSGEVRLEVYSMLGQRLAVLVQGQQPAGWHTVTLDATSWASGTYIYRLQADGFTQTKKFLLVK